MRTLVLIKRDAIEKEVWLDIIKIYESHGLRIIKTLLIPSVQSAFVERLYAAHIDRPFYNELVSYMTGGTIIALMVEGEDAIVQARKLNGATNPANAAEGTVRFLYGTRGVGPANAVHGSGSPEEAERELALFFGSTK